MPRSFETREQLLCRVIQLLVDHPLEHLSLQGIAERCDTTIWVLRRAFGNVDRVFRAAAIHLIEQVRGRADYTASETCAVVDAIEQYARFVAALVRSPEYLHLLYFVIRNGNHHKWLQERYEQRVVAKIRADLEAVVRAAGERHGIVVSLLEGASRRFHKRIETEFALATLLPPHDAREAPLADRVLKEIVRETYDSTYVLDWQIANTA